MAYCPFLGTRSPLMMADYGPKKLDISRAANSIYSVTPAGISCKITADDTTGFSSLATGHGIVKTFTQLCVIYHAEGSAFSTTWPDFRIVLFSRDSGTGVFFQIDSNTDKIALRYFTGGAYVNVTDPTVLPFKQPFAVACRLRAGDGDARVFRDGLSVASNTGVLDSSLAATSFAFHRVSGTGEWSPYHVLAHYIWRDAKSDDFIRRISQDWAGPFRRQRRATWVAPAAPAGGNRRRRLLIGATR